MEEIQTIEKLKGKVENEKNREKDLRRTELIKNMNYYVEEILECGRYLQEYGRKYKDFEIPIIKEISNKIGCSLIKYDNEIYICIDKEPDKGKVKESVLCKYFTEIKDDLLSWPVYSFILCCGVNGLRLLLSDLEVDNILDWTSVVVLLFFLVSFIPAIRMSVRYLMIKGKYLVNENGIYIFKK